MIVLLDNGHGNNTPGKCSPDGVFREYKWAREEVRLIQEALKAKGITSQILVPEENDVPLSARVQRANAVCNKYGARNVLLISVHVNAAGADGRWHNATGWAAYTTKGVTRSDQLATCLYDAAKKHLVGKRIRTDYSDGDPDWEANFYIIKHANCPAVLTESFFQDNKADVSYLLSKEGRDQICKVHVDGIIDFINKSK